MDMLYSLTHVIVGNNLTLPPLSLHQVVTEAAIMDYEGVMLQIFLTSDAQRLSFPIQHAMGKDLDYGLPHLSIF